jgi:LysR family transcriptional regulator, low CO2-responsive transcriptional regulator
MTLWQLKAFATVASEGSFTKAGKILHITQPSVSALVIDLQKELKVKLFEKLGTRPHLTEAGRRLLPIVVKALGMIDTIPEEMAAVSGLKKGRLVVGGSGFAGATLLPFVVQAFKTSFPSIEIKATIRRSGILEEGLLDGKIDVALMGNPPKSRLIVARPYREENVVVVAPPNHPLTKRRSVPLELLAKEPIVAEEEAHLTTQAVERVFVKAGLPFKPALEINVGFGSRDAIKTAVANGLGISFMPDHMITFDVQWGRLAVLKVPELKLKRIMYLAVHKRRQNSLTQMFIDFLTDYKE